MADTKISQLPAATTPTGAEVVPVLQGGTNKRTTAADLAATLPEATTNAAGKMPAAAVTKLTGIAAYATANATDAQLRDRSTHTGTQPAGTITGLASVATSGAYADLSGRPTLGTAAATDASAYATAAQGSKADSAIQPGQAVPNLVAVRNNSGGTLTIGTPVYATGSSGTQPTVAAADASLEATAAQALGLMNATASNNSDGVVITHGILSGVNTASLTEGGIVWLSETTGQLTSTRPTQPAHGVFMGFCIKQGSGTSGILYVNVINGQELNELHDVLISGASTGQVLALAADGLWKNKTLAAADVGAATAAQGSLAASAIQPGAYSATAGLTLTTARILGRSTAGTGAAEELSLAAGLNLVSGVVYMEPWLGFACSDESTAITTGTSKLRFRMPFACTLLAVIFEAKTAPTGSAAVFDLNEAGTSVFSTNPRIDAGGNDSSLSGTPAVISDSSIAAGAVMTVDFDQIGSTVAGAGIKMWINVRRTA